MSRDRIILTFFWIIPIVALLLFVPKNKTREAALIFLFKQGLTWILGLTVVELKLIEYPVRSFPYATRACFDFEYFVYPVTCIMFILHYPKSKKFLNQFMYYFYYCSVLTGIEIIVEKYTNILNYIHWAWYITWVSFFITFSLSHRFYIWFFKLKTQGQLENNN